MSYTNETTHYGIPKPLGTDLTTPMDYNEAADAIDTAVWGATQDAATAVSDAASAVSTAEGAASDVSALGTRVTTLEGTVTTQGTAITGLASDIADVRADVTDNICAVKEATATATYAHAKGTFFYYNDILYRTAVAIGIGDTIVPNTNCEAVTVATILDDFYTAGYTDAGLVASGCTINWGGYVRIGNMVTVCIRFVISEAGCAIGGFPVPPFAIGFGGYDTVQEQATYAYIGQDGQLHVPTAYGSTGTLEFAVTYFV